MDGLLFKKLDLFDHEALEAKFSTEEIRCAVWDNNMDKSPCPDELNFKFIQ